MLRLIEELFPICRSITGNGVRETLRVLRNHIPLEINEVPSGTTVFDWRFPPNGTSALHTLHASMARALFILLTTTFISCNIAGRSTRSCRSSDSAFAPSFACPIDQAGFRTAPPITQKTGASASDLLGLVTTGLMSAIRWSSISIFLPGHLTYGELFIPGSTDDTVLFSCHICHPSLANDNLSGIAVATMLARHIQTLTPRYSYRFLFIPGTIGSLTCLARNDESWLGGSLTASSSSCLGDAGLYYLQAKPPRERSNRPRRHACVAPLSCAGPQHQALLFHTDMTSGNFALLAFNLPLGCLHTHTEW